MREDGYLAGYGMAMAPSDVPALERIDAALAAALWARSCLPARRLIVAEITSIVRKPLPGSRLTVRIHLTRRGHPCRSR